MPRALLLEAVDGREGGGRGWARQREGGGAAAVAALVDWRPYVGTKDETALRRRSASSTASTPTSRRTHSSGSPGPRRGQTYGIYGDSIVCYCVFAERQRRTRDAFVYGLARCAPGRPLQPPSPWLPGVPRHHQVVAESAIQCPFRAMALRCCLLRPHHAHLAPAPATGRHPSALPRARG